jgi:hypothetical protein
MENDTSVNEQFNCFYCQQLIPIKAKVCHHCNKYQSRIFNNVLSINAVTTLISLVFLAIAFFQYLDSRTEKENSIEAAKNANYALQQVQKVEQRVLVIREDILKTSEAFIEMAEVLPRSTGFGLGLSEEDRKKLNTHSDSLKSLIKKLKTN